MKNALLLKRMKIAEIKKAIAVLEHEPGYSRALSVLRDELLVREGVKRLKRSIRRMRAEKRRLDS